MDITTLEDTGVLHPLDPEITEKNYDIVSGIYNTLINLHDTIIMIKIVLK